MAALQSMVQQALETSNKMAQNLTTFERDVSSKLNDQQNKLGAPVATMGSKVDQMSDDFRSVATNVADLVRRMGALDSKLADISSAIRTLSTPAAPPPQAVFGAGSALAIRWATIPPQVAMGMAATVRAATVEAVVTVEEGAMAAGAVIKDAL